MKTAINIEFTPRDLERFVSNTGQRILVRTIVDVLRSVQVDPSTMRAMIQILNQGVEMGVAAGRDARRRRRHPAPGPAYPPWAVPWYPPPPSDGGAAPSFQWPEGSGPFDPLEEIRRRPSPRSPLPFCMITSAPEGWICCMCRAFNDSESCEECGHPRCSTHTARKPENPDAEDSPSTEE